MKNYRNKRRQFLKNIGMTALGATTVPSVVFGLNTWAAAAANNSAITGDYKALVCINLSGGNDGFNMLVPRDNAAYGEYANSRGNLALPQEGLEGLLAINPLGSPTGEFGLHPNMSEVQQLFEDEKLSFLCNIGTKTEADTTATDFQNQIKVPLSLMSHNEQSQQWQTARSGERSGLGWAGKIADMFGDMGMNSNSDIPMNVSFFGSPTFLQGNETTHFSLTKFGPRLFQYSGNNPDTFHGRRGLAFQEMYNHDYGNAFQNNYNSIFQNAISTNAEYEAALAAAPAISSPFSVTGISQDLKAIAQSISIGESLGFNRQIFFIQISAYDMHKNLLTDHSNQLGILSKGISEFIAALEEIGKDDCVATFTISDFGRTLTSNGNAGSDHAWGSNAMVAGGPVIGKTLFGDYPSLALNSDNEVIADANRGILIPTTATDVYFAELAHWFGVPMSDLPMIFPNLYKFMITEGATTDDLPLGFLNIQ